mgnify:CR=1 FL=1
MTQAICAAPPALLLSSQVVKMPVVRVWTAK